jgi:Phosphotransferase enzyme family
VVGCTLNAEQQPSDQHGRAAQRALRAVHNRGFCHGDLSDDNIMLTLTADGSDDVRLIDFGCSSDGASVELQEAEERELASIFAAKVSGCCTASLSHDCTMNASNHKCSLQSVTSCVIISGSFSTGGDPATPHTAAQADTNALHTLLLGASQVHVRSQMLLLLGCLADMGCALHTGVLHDEGIATAQTWLVSQLLVQLATQQRGRAQEVQQLPFHHGNTFGIAAAVPFCKQGRGQSKLPAAAEHK